MGSVGIILVVVYTLRGEEIRLISARHATRHEVTSYEG
ncbi:BrnT family toxin [Sulfuricaulis sp.]